MRQLRRGSGLAPILGGFDSGNAEDRYRHGQAENADGYGAGETLVPSGRQLFLGKQFLHRAPVFPSTAGFTEKPASPGTLNSPQSEMIAASIRSGTDRSEYRSSSKPRIALCRLP
ncbi:hypothetical protein [Novosphingobium sp. THN1]|uniref:hypothetical protein n=1 Tax=Novosphingobium sp. THN1 TaxID=1016987 RepID=UPI001F07DB3F|nr:hypothetical protein [Novosphingobium sp. THN1]